MGYLDQLKHQLSPKNQNNVALRMRYTCPQPAANWYSIHYVCFLRDAVLWSIWTSQTSIAFALCFCTLTQRCFGNPTLVWEARLRRWFTAPLNSCSIIWNIARQRKLYIFKFWLSYVVVWPEFCWLYICCVWYNFLLLFISTVNCPILHPEIHPSHPNLIQSIYSITVCPSCLKCYHCCEKVQNMETTC